MMDTLAGLNVNFTKTQLTGHLKGNTQELKNKVDRQKLKPILGLFQSESKADISTIIEKLVEK